MIMQTYVINDMPKRLREDEVARKKFISGIETDLKYEFESSLFLPKIVKAEMDVTGYDLVIEISVDWSDARFLDIVLHNLHGAKKLG
jgi:hypothetical protein